MYTRKRILSIVLTLAVVVMFPVSGVRAADPAAELLLPREIPEVGEAFSVRLSIAGNPGFSSLGATLAFDPIVVECTGIEIGEALAGMMTADNNRAPDGARIAAASAEDVAQDGIVAAFSFRVLAAGNPDLKLSRFAAKRTDGTEVSFKLLSGALDDRPSAPAGPAVHPGDGGGETQPGLPAQNEENGTEEASAAFTDTAGHWGEQFILEAARRKLFEGYPDGSFQPDRALTRAEFVTLLWRMADKPAAQQPTAFTDIVPGAWYAEAVSWAKETGLVDGVSATEFAPNIPLQRQAAMKILFAYSGGAAGGELLLTGIYDNAFADSGEIAAWGKPGLYWAYYNGLITGVGNDRLDPGGLATRAQIATILVNYQDSYSK